MFQMNKTLHLVARKSEKVRWETKISQAFYHQFEISFENVTRLMNEIRKKNRTMQSTVNFSRLTLRQLLSTISKRKMSNDSLEIRNRLVWVDLEVNSSLI